MNNVAIQKKAECAQKALDVSVQMNDEINKFIKNEHGEFGQLIVLTCACGKRGIIVTRRKS